MENVAWKQVRMVRGNLEGITNSLGKIIVHAFIPEASSYP